ncbi:type II toxin-antitoxin system VapC family toxin [Thiorhodococcus mannitoliphagus]|uniref:Ribonuclease VapC n=1 Tax=Thiorhodococcus mannitoliphagus TaxID=329406 RepID=A0A6P1E1X5_9GAMM|nr:type II toxin-antitoxin system VapC family toxin [Thiorhodococcus mannitoliphagus]NEX23780.1 type II toxin-antitoxin system VapC family toxin [Thiorhodococcus mannitoliphagus]
MILLDTNILSEFMTAPPAASVRAWLNAQNTTDLYLTSISIAEICFGLQAMPQGRRRQLLMDRFELFLTTAFESRILSFDQDAARAYGAIRGQRRALGRPMSNFDGQIAAIARTRGFSLATRNTKDFEDCGLELIDPFSFVGSAQ